MKRMEACGVVAILRLRDPSPIPDIAEAILNGGITVIEVTLNTPNALQAVSGLRRRFGDSLLVGAGTVTGPDQAEVAVRAGAQFLISPVFKLDIIRAAHALNRPAIPGCTTPTEMLHAHETGADAIKLFPAECFGPAYLKSVLAPLNHLRIMPTGGINASNAADWLRAGAFCLGAGGGLVDPTAVSESRLDVLTHKARLLKDTVDRAKKNPD